MGKVALGPNEAILKQDSNIYHDRHKFTDSWGDELVLTNLNLIVIHQSTLFRGKEEVRYPLSKVKVVGNSVQALPGKSSNGSKALLVYFTDGVECFILGESDDDEDEVSLRKIFSSTADREKKNIAEWCDAISAAVLGTRCTPQGAKKTPVRQVKIEKKTLTTRCIGCMAPLTGTEGQMVKCKYCDIEQAI